MVKLKNINKLHYVYRITNIILKKHYYGVRTSNIEPKNDLGFKYFSSSTDKEFIKDQKDNPQNYKYKIIKIFNDRLAAYTLEIKLHSKFNVSFNNSFYNKSRATSTGFSGVNNLGKKRTKAQKLQLSLMRRGSDCSSSKIINIYDAKDNLKFKTHGDFTKVCKKNKLPFRSLVRSYQKQIPIYMTNNTSNIKRLIETGNIKYKGWYALEEGKKLKNRTPIFKSKLHIFDNNCNLVYKCDDYFENFCDKNNLPLNAFSKSYLNKGIPIYINLPKNISNLLVKNGDIKYKCWFAVNIETDNIEEILIRNKKIIKEDKEKKLYNSLKIDIFDDKDNLKFKCFGDFEEVCNNNDLPYRELQKSYQNEGRLIYINLNKNINSRLIKNGKIKYKGWYAKKIVFDNFY